MGPIAFTCYIASDLSVRLAATLFYMNPADVATYGQLMVISLLAGMSLTCGR